jgi:fluoroacetyl-CoA thioesterase
VLPVPDGATTELEVVVTPEMTVRFDRLGPVHPVYATYRMAQHFEEAGRALLLPFLESGEDAVGSAVSVEHLAPAPVGTVVRIEAGCTGVDGNRVTCACRAVDAAGRLLGTGTTVQVVLPRSALADRLGEGAG